MTDPSPTPGPASTRPVEDPSWLDIVWGQFRKRRVAFAALYGVLALWVIAITAPIFFSDQPFVWSGGDGLELPWLAAFFNRKVYRSAIDVFFNLLLFPGGLFAIPAWIAWRRAGDLPRRQRAARRQTVLGLAVGAWALVLALVLLFPRERAVPDYLAETARLEEAGTPPLAIFPLKAISYADTDPRRSMLKPSADHLLGTDQAGSDVLARMVFGTRVSLTVGVFAVSIYCVFGTIVGAVAGFFGGRVDALLMRLVEVVICIPSLFLILSVAAFIQGRSIFHIMFIIAAVAWTGPARLVRAEFLRLRELDFVSAARAAGFSKAQIIFAEILPNALGPVLVSATFGVASAILVESTMSFLGLGDSSVPSWGQILATGRATSSWLLILVPGAAIFATVSLLNLLGEGVRDALDPKLRS